FICLPRWTAQQFRGSLETTWLDPQNFIYWMDPRLGERTVRRHALFYSGYAFLGKKKSKRQSRSSVVPLPICDTYRINDRRDRSIFLLFDLYWFSTTKCVDTFHLEARTAFPKTQELLLDCPESNLSVLSYRIVLLKIFSLNLPHPPDLEPVQAQLRLLPAVRLVDGLSCDGVRL
ncbi:hypothetical protein B0H14DRAFT_2867179, partial [Mycena olivaceomarginata]